MTGVQTCALLIYFISRGMLPSERPPPLRDRDEGEDGEPVDDEQVLGNVVLARCGSAE